MPVINMPKALVEKLGQDGADALADIFTKYEESIKNGTIEVVEERFARRLTEEISSLRTEMKVGFAETKSSLIRWMFAFWVGQFALVVGLILALQK